jgi:amidase
MTDMPFRPAARLAAAIREKEIGCLELLDLYINRVERLDRRLNAVVVQDFERARTRARQLDNAVANVGPLHGVPMTVKESYDVTGLPTTWGDPRFRDHIANRNAVVVERLLEAGAVIFGKTNVPIHLGDWQATNAIYGTTNNPWDTARMPGGSSGGSAAVLAAGLAALEVGSDIGSSIRNPAHFCGVWGHKPTWGIVPRDGQALPWQAAPVDIDVVGPLGRSSADLALALSVIAGPGPLDAFGWRLELPKPRQVLLRDFKVALMIDVPGFEIDKAVHDRLIALANFLERQQVTVDYRARPAIEPAETMRVFTILLRSATSDRQSDADFAANWNRAQALDALDQSYHARSIRGAVLSHRDWLAANEARHRMRRAWAEFFRDFDLLLCPVAPVAALPHDHGGERHQRTMPVNGRMVPVTDHLFWAGHSGLAYLPATAAPCGFTPSGLPVGVQIVGPAFGDLICIEFARHLEQEFQSFVPPPGFD